MITQLRRLHAWRSTLKRLMQSIPLKSIVFLRCFIIAGSWLLLTFSVNAQNNKLWPMAGGDVFNSRNAAGEKKISPGNASHLTVKWVLNTDGDISATPAVDKDAVYFPDWAGFLYKVNAATGQIIWKKAFKDYTGESFSVARATPAIAGNMLIIGTQLSAVGAGAYVLGINKITGALAWRTLADPHPAAVITQSAAVNGNTAYVGVASLEENFAADPNYACCSFRGSLLSLDVKTGRIIWKTYMTPQNKGFSGNAVWGSTPVVDAKRNSLYITTGNNYKVPDAVLACNAPGKTADEVRQCIMAVDGSNENYFDAVVALDLTTGAFKWVTRVIPFDAWNVACFFEGPNCPDNAGPDYDFGQGPAFFTAGTGSNKRELLGAGQKSGIYWAFNPTTGEIVWQTKVGPGGTLGGLQWGSAVDGKQIYTAISNNNYEPFPLTKGPGAGTTVKGGFWSALDAATGAINWQTAASLPPVPIQGFPPPPDGAVAINTGMVTVANGVVFAGALDIPGTMYAFNAATGQTLWSFQAGGSINSGAAVVDGTVYWGSGYSNLGLGTPSRKFYAFQVADAALTSVSTKTVKDEITSSTKASILVYPSLAKDMLKVVSQDNSHIQFIKVFDQMGRLVKEVKPLSGSSVYNLNLSAVPTGSYFISVATTTLYLSTKVSVTH